MAAGVGGRLLALRVPLSPFFISTMANWEWGGGAGREGEGPQGVSKINPD